MEKRILVIIISLISLFHATLLFGEIYNADTFSRLDNVRIRIEGPVSSQLIASGNYSIDLPPGNYTIVASYFKNGRLDLYTEDSVSINDHAVRFDLLLLPYALQNLIPSDSTNGSVVSSTSEPLASALAPVSFPLEILVIVVIVVIGLVIYFISRKEQSNVFVQPKTQVPEPPQATTTSEEPYYLDSDSRKLLEIVKSQGGRCLQKELREITKMSESSMSLILSELEAVGYIKRFKRGRENLVKLIKELKS